MVTPLTKNVLAALALGVAIGAVSGCSTDSTKEAAKQQSSALEIGDCELTRSQFKCSIQVQGFRCDHNLPTAFERGDGEGDSLEMACAVAAAQVAIGQANDKCHAWGNHIQHVEEKTRVNKGQCKAYVTGQGALTLSGGSTLLPSGGWWVNGVGVQPGSPGASGVFLQ